jgi:hypothetical protein
MILEMIDASCELAQKLGAHDLYPSCPFMACATLRKKRL